MHEGFVIYNNIHWHTKDHFFERFVQCLHQVQLFLSDNQNCNMGLTDLD